MPARLPWYPEKRTTAQPAAKPAAAGGTESAKTAASLLQAQPLSLAQAGSNQFQALAATATNGILAALGMTNQIATTTNQVQALLEQAKKLSGSQKYQEALGTLTQLYETKLTPQQKQQADDLKAQIQTAMAQKAASALGNFLGGKK